MINSVTPAVNYFQFVPMDVMRYLVEREFHDAVEQMPFRSVCRKFRAVIPKVVLQSDKIYLRAAEYDNPSLLEWLYRTNKKEPLASPWSSLLCIAAAKKGQLGVLQWAREKGCAWNYKTSAAAALGGHLELLKWARYRKFNGVRGFSTSRKASNPIELPVCEMINFEGI